MKDVLLIPDSRSRQAQMRRNRLLEQTMRHLATIQRLTMQEKKGDLDAQTVAITRLANPITQVVRLHHQLWREDASPDDILDLALTLAGLDNDGGTEEETR